MPLKRIEIYLSESSPEDMQLYALWRTLSAQGKGRAQNIFRSALLGLVDTPDVHRRAPLKRGPKPTWQPPKSQVGTSRPKLSETSQLSPSQSSQNPPPEETPVTQTVPETSHADAPKEDVHKEEVSAPEKSSVEPTILEEQTEILTSALPEPSAADVLRSDEDRVVVPVFVPKKGKEKKSKFADIF